MFCVPIAIIRNLMLSRLLLHTEAVKNLCTRIAIKAVDTAITIYCAGEEVESLTELGLDFGFDE